MIFETLRELENDGLWFSKIEYDNWNLRIEVTSNLKWTDIDWLIRLKLMGTYSLKLVSYEWQPRIPPSPCYPTSESEIKYWQETVYIVDHTFCYSLTKSKPSDDVSGLQVGESPWVPKDFVAENLAFLNRHGTFDKQDVALVSESSCPDCKGSGFYTPFVGPQEPCQTCQVSSPVADVEFGDDFKARLLGRLVNIDLSPMVFSVGPLPDEYKCNVECPVGDNEEHKTSGYFYNLIVATLKQSFSGQELKLDFSRLAVTQTYDVSGIILYIKFNIEVL